MVRNKRFRFVQASGSTMSDLAITSDDIITSVGAMCTVANSTLTSIAMAFRLRFVEVWATYDLGVNGSFCSVAFDQTRMPGMQFSDVSVNPTRPVHVFARPPKDSLASFWINNGSSATSMFSISAPPGAIVDICVDYVIQDPDTINSTKTRTVITATLGRMYYTWLDSGSVWLRPIGHEYTS